MQYLDIMVGPSGAGKSTYVGEHYAEHEIIETDAIRRELFGSHDTPEAFTAENLAKTWDIAYGVLQIRLSCKMRTVFDATNLKQIDRFKLLRHVPLEQQVRYIVIDRPIAEKMENRGWRPRDLIVKHHNTFMLERNNIMNGDWHPQVIEVVDHTR